MRAAWLKEAHSGCGARRRRRRRRRGESRPLDPHGMSTAKEEVAVWAEGQQGGSLLGRRATEEIWGRGWQWWLEILVA
jgi:hypothetical protein